PAGAVDHPHARPRAGDDGAGDQPLGRRIARHARSAFRAAAVTMALAESASATAPAAASEEALAITDLRTSFHTIDGVVRAVDGVSWTLAKGEILGVVGESGCGKSVTALSIMG